jgi:hypothetical protein
MCINILGHKAGLNKFTKSEIISNILSDHNGQKLKSTARETV